MDRTTEIDLIKRVLRHVDARTTDAAPAPTRLPVARYADRARVSREIDALFRRLPVAVAHVSELAAPGDFVTREVAGVPLLVSRGDDGQLHAFLNVCRHRGTRVAGAPCGRAKSFVCPYHAWTYARDGRLVGVPHAGGFAGVDRGARGLVRVPVEDVAGLVFVRARPIEGAGGDPRPLDAAAFVGPLAKDLEGFGVASSHVYAPRVETRALSWKLALDVFLEAYHLKTTHADTIYRLFFDNLAVVEMHGPHLRNLFPKRSIRELADRPEAEWSLRAHSNVLYHLFPNTLVLVQPDHSAVVQMFPEGPAKTTIASYTLVPEPPATDKARAYWDANNAVLYGATAEDLAMGESIQAGLSSALEVRPDDDVVFGAFEHALAHFHAQIEAHVGR